MAVTSNLAAITITSMEQNTVANAVANGSAFADATGIIKAALDEANQLIIKLTALNNAMPSGSNKTAIATIIGNLA